MKTLLNSVAGLVVFFFVAFADVAHADLFTFNFAGGGQNASGFLNANPTGMAGQFLITSISGTLIGMTISGLLPVNSFDGNDNLLFASNGNFLPDSAGFSFQTVGGIQGNVFTFTTAPFTGQQFLARSDGALAQMTTFQITPAAVPEPASWMLLGTGALGMVQAARRRLLSRS